MCYIAQSFNISRAVNLSFTMKSMFALLGLAAIASCASNITDIACKSPIVILGQGAKPKTLQDRKVPFAAEFDVNGNSLPAVSAEELYSELSGFMSLDSNKQREYYGLELLVNAGYQTVEFGGDFKSADPEQLGSSTVAYHNLTVTKKGESPKTIVFGAHLDKVKPGKGVIDNGSGSVVVANLAQSLHGVGTKYTYKFVLFTLEEEGLIGSGEYARGVLARDSDNFVYMMNFDCVGVKDNAVLGDLSVSEITDVLLKISRQRGFDLAFMETTPGSTDSLSFIAKELPAGSISATSLWGKIHSQKDVIESINKEELAEAYRIGLDLIYVSEKSNF